MSDIRSGVWTPDHDLPVASEFSNFLGPAGAVLLGGSGSPLLDFLPAAVLYDF